MKNISWRNFTWKRFLWFSLFVFIATFITMMIWNYFDPEEKIANLFKTGEIVKRVFLSCIIGAAISLTSEREKE